MVHVVTEEETEIFKDSENRLGSFFSLSAASQHALVSPLDCFLVFAVLHREDPTSLYHCYVQK